MAIKMISREPAAQPAKAQMIAARSKPAETDFIRTHDLAMTGDGYAVETRVAATKKVGRPSSGKVVVTIRLDPDVIAKFKTPVEKGWQSRINEALKTAKV